MARKFAACLRDNAELLTTPSLSHLSQSTHRKRVVDELSVNAYPTDRGGIIYVGIPHFRMPKAVANRVRLDLSTAVMDDMITVVSCIQMRANARAA